VSLLLHDRYKQLVLLLLLVLFLATCIKPPYPQFLLMQHAPTVLGGVLLACMANRFAMSRLSFTSVAVFLALHTVGARYLYSYTPYDELIEALFGVNITELFGFKRNHYDRWVHFSYGLLMAVPIQEFERRHLKLSVALSSVLAVECIIATSASYEMIEWLVAVIFTPDWADQFLGQQGDLFDAQKDMALAVAGALVSITALAIKSCHSKLASETYE
jgi:putative membrane protein